MFMIIYLKIVVINTIYLIIKVIQQTLDNHYNKNINSEFKIWSLIQFNSWYNKFIH